MLCVFLSYFFMSIMFPTIFALGIFGLGARAKKASAYIVMAIMGGAILPKLMGAVADKYDMSRGFIVPVVCFAFIAYYGYNWPKYSKAESLHGVGTTQRPLTRNGPGGERAGGFGPVHVARGVRFGARNVRGRKFGLFGG